ncbi:MAG TPA: hypothetical protein PKZ76_13080 [Xanthomonadaceae bacterium]|nr:hypothetical protein [Xanthomonadaceae bacterium]
MSRGLSKYGSAQAGHLPPMRFEWSDAAWLALAAAVAAVIHGWIAAYAVTVTTFTDSIDYLLMADFYRAALHGGDTVAAAGAYQVTRFPPLFPALLGVFGAGSDMHHLAAVVANSIAVLAIVAVWLWVRLDRDSAKAATLVSVSLLVLPFYFAINLVPVSEPLGIFLMAAAFALLAVPKPTQSRLLVAALLIGIAPLARTALLPLPIAYLIWMAIARPLSWKRLLLPAMVAWLPTLLWAAYRRGLGSERYAELLSSERFAIAGMTWPEALWQQPLRAFDAFVACWGVPASPMLQILTLCLTVLALGGGLLRLRGNRIDAWFLGGYLAMILIWPFPEELRRFLVVVYPCLLLCSLTALQALACGRLPVGMPIAVGGLMAVVVAATLPGGIHFSRRAMLPVDKELLGDKREPGFFLMESDTQALQVAEVYARARILLQEATDVVPTDACIYGVPEQIVLVYSRRQTVAYPTGLGVDPVATADALQHCDYFFVAAWHASAYGVRPLYPSEGLLGWTEPVLVSSMMINNQPRVAAALLMRKERQLEHSEQRGRNGSRKLQ